MHWRGQRRSWHFPRYEFAGMGVNTYMGVQEHSDALLGAEKFMTESSWRFPR